MNNDFKREGRILMLYQRALRKKYTQGGRFSETQLYNDAIAIGVGKTTAQSYTDAVITKLKQAGHLQ